MSTVNWPETNGKPFAYLALFIAVASVFLMELMIGAVGIPLRDVLAILWNGTTSRETWDQIVIQFRLPRAFNAMVSGAAMGVCGLMLQTVFRNPLADPYVLGVVHGSRLAVAIVVVIAGAAGDSFSSRFGFIGELSLTTAAAIGCGAVMLLIAAAARRVSTVTLLIVGLMIGYTCIGLISAVLHLTDEGQARVFESWNGGSFDGITRSQLTVLTPIVIAGLILAHSLVKPLNALILGEGYARSMGINIRTTRWISMICISMLVGSVTAYCGPIPFLGLIAAHICRGLLKTTDHRFLMPAAMLMGALVGLTADLIIHLPWSRHLLHLDAVIGMIGGPVALWVLLRHRNTRALEL
jgi:iron complex transport system permease protein